jgi:hypothetical protein
MRLHPDTRQPTAATLAALDGSWTTVDLEENDGARHVTEAGPTPLWAEVEHAYDQWITLGEPEWPRFGVTATHGRQWIWLDAPIGPHTWNITPTD